MDEVFGLSRPLWEIGFRATIGYVVLVILVRVVPKRNAGHISPNDLLTLIVIGGMGSIAVIGGSTSVGDVLLAILVILAWAYLLDKCEYHFPIIRRLLRDKPTLLIEEGRMLRKNMRRELVTEQELMAVLRLEGIEDLAQVEVAMLEADGEISVIKRS